MQPVRSLNRPSFVLASRSPRRRELLGALGLSFVVDTSDVDETPLPGEAPDAMVCRLCRAKALAVAQRRAGQPVLAADTLVVLDGVLLGKPADALEAAAMLRALRDRTHVVYTAVCLAHDGEVTMGLSANEVTMRAYTDQEIEAYVHTGDPLDKAGAYGIQDPQFAPVSRWEGCYAAVMGLPLGLATELLAAAGITTPMGVPSACESMTRDRCCLRNGGPAPERRAPCSGR